MSHSLSDEELFEQVIRLATPAARRALLDQVCANDPERRQHLEELLHAHELAGSFLAAPADPSEKTQRSGRSEEPGTQIGRYKLLEQIGEGGFGAVWAAEQREPVKRRVALKIIKLGMDTKQVIARFEAERQALALMDHPNIAKVLDAGATETGRPYFVMELVRGVGILDYCDTEKLDAARRLHLFIQVCNAIQHAHQKGIIHRDIKPSNVMVTLHDGVPVPKVIDFGIAKATNTELTTKTLFTQYGQMIGTPAYMSPEQAEMSGLDIDTRSDIYALGVLLYELLTGTTPFDAKELLSKGFAEIMRIIREVEPPKPSTRLSTLGESASRTAQQRHTDVKRLGVLLRGDLDWIVMKCLEKDRGRRYDTANGLAMDLQRHLGDEPVVAGPPSRGYRLQKFIRRNRGKVIAAGLVAAALVLGIAGTTWGMLSAMRERTRVEAQAQRASDALRQVTEGFAGTIAAKATEPITVPIVQSESGAEVEALARTAVNLVRSLDASRQQTQRELTRAEEVKRLIGDMLRGVSPEEAQGADTRLLTEILDETAARLERGEVNDELVAAELHDVIGSVYWRLGQYEQADCHLPVALATYERVLGEDHPSTLGAMNALGVLRKYEGRYGEAEHWLDKSLKLMQREFGEEDLSTLTTMSNLGTVYLDQRRVADAELILRNTLTLMERALPPEHRATLLCMNALAGVYREEARYADSERLFRRLLKLQRHALGDEHPETVMTRINLGLVLTDRGQLVEAEELLTPALEQAKRVFGGDHLETTRCMADLAYVYRKQHRFADTELLFSKVLEIRKRVLGTGHRDTLGAEADLALLYNDMGRYEDAVAKFESCLPIMRRKLGLRHPWTGFAMRGLEKAYAALGRDDDALALHAEILELQTVDAEKQEADAIALNHAAWTLLTCDVEELRDPHRALPLAERACAAEEAQAGSNLWMYLDTLALAQHRSGDTSKAIETARRAVSLIPAGTDKTIVAEMKANLATFGAALVESSGSIDDGAEH